jgi:hypothetical protein
MLIIPKYVMFYFLCYILCSRIREKNGSTEYSKGNKTVPGKVATTLTEHGHNQNTKTTATIF